MKKTKVLFIVLLFTGVFNFSCKAFMTGNDLSEKIIEAIEENKKHYARITVDAPISRINKITPAVGAYYDVYKEGDTIKLNFEPNERYVFIGWKIILTQNGNNTTCNEKNCPVSFGYIDDKTKEFIAYKIEDEINWSGDLNEYKIPGYKKNEVTIKINPIKDGMNQFTITPVTGIHPQVLGSTPSYMMSEVNRATEIKFYFDKPIDKNSIYYTYDEIKNLSGHEPEKEEIGLIERMKYAIDQMNSGMNPENKMYYAYENDEGNPIFKNIEIFQRQKDGSPLSLLNYYGAPELEDDYTLVIPVKDNKSDEKNLPARTNVQFKINKEFRCIDEEGSVPLCYDYSSGYLTGRFFDNSGPKLADNEVYIDSLMSDDFTNINLIEQKKEIETGAGTQFVSIKELLEDENTSLEELISCGVVNTKKISLDKAKFIDESGIRELVMTLTPVENKFYDYTGLEPLIAYYPVNNLKELDCAVTPIEFDFIKNKTACIYRITLTAEDVNGYMSEFRFGGVRENKDVYCILDTINIVSTIDDIVYFDKSETNPSLYNVVKGPAGKYLWILTDIAISPKTDVNSVFNNSEAADYKIQVTNPERSMAIKRCELKLGLSSRLIYGYLLFQNASGDVTWKKVADLPGKPEGEPDPEGIPVPEEPDPEE